jgi:hypothetical protein
VWLVVVGGVVVGGVVVGGVAVVWLAAVGRQWSCCCVAMPVVSRVRQRPRRVAIGCVGVALVLARRV